MLTPPSSFKPHPIDAPFMLSNNYYVTYTLRLTTNTEIFFDVTDVTLTAEFDFFSDTQFNIIFTSNYPTDPKDGVLACSISLSETIMNDPVSFTSSQLTSTKLYSNSDLPFFSRVTYNCQGSSGDFPKLPINLTTAGKIVTTPIVVNGDLTGSTNHITKTSQSWFGKFFSFFSFRDMLKWIKYLAIIIAVGAIIALIVWGAFELKEAKFVKKGYSKITSAI